MTVNLTFTYVLILYYVVKHLSEIICNVNIEIMMVIIDCLDFVVVAVDCVVPRTVIKTVFCF